MSTTTDERTFSVSETAKMFDRSVPWLRWREKNGDFIHEDGSQIEIARTTPRRAKYGYRRYTVQNILDMADALDREKKITALEAERVRTLVRAYQT